MTQPQPYDAVIIGGGHNGLVAACYLAKAGHTVLVLERHHTVGGAAVTEEIHPGFRVSVASYSMSLMRPEIISELRLADYGFEVYAKNPSYFMPYPDGGHLFLYAGERERSKEQIAKFSPRDAANYDAWEDFWDRCCDIIEPTLLASPPRLAALDVVVDARPDGRVFRVAACAGRHGPAVADQHHGRAANAWHAVCVSGARDWSRYSRAARRMGLC
jgi:phytoene dehydrogenase-like protein